MISVKNLSTLLGKQVVDEQGNIGRIAFIDHSDTNYPIRVSFGEDGVLWFTKEGIPAGFNASHHITIYEETPLGIVVEETMQNYNLTPEELISFILDKYF